jgi:hypothetical protein
MKQRLHKVLFFCFLCVSQLAFGQDTTPVFSAYYGLKDALVATNPVRAKTEAAAFVQAVKALKSDKLSDSVKKSLRTASTQAVAISQATDIEKQRRQFEGMTPAMIGLAKATKSAKAYVQYCPMAMDGKGASWLSNKREVRNPYYGNKMLTCGSVKEEI